MKGDYMNIRQLECFVEVATTLNFTQASKNLHLSQTAVTNHIKHLENEIGFDLFERNKKKVFLTNNGNIFLTSAKKVLESDHACQQTILKLQKGITGEINIGYLRGLEQCLMANVLSNYFQNHQETNIHLFRGNHEELSNLLKGNEVDCIFSSIIGNNPKPYVELDNTYSAFLLHSYSLVAAINKNHPLAQSKTIDYNQLKNEIVLDIDSSDTTKPSRNLDNTLLKIAINSCAAVLGDFIVEHAHQNQFIRFLPVTGIDSKFSIYIIFDKNNQNITFNHFLETALEKRNLKDIE